MHAGLSILHISDAEGRGVVVTQAVAEGERLLCVPRRLMLDETRLARDLGGLVQACHELHENETLLATAFLLIAAQGSGLHPPAPGAPSWDVWRPYLDALPTLQELQGMPLLWSAEDVASVRSKQWQEEVARAQADASSERCVLDTAFAASCKGAAAGTASGGTPAGDMDALSPPPALLACLRAPTEEEFLWARCCVASRTFLDGGHMDEEFLFAEAAHMMPVVMVPVADMMNHACHGVTCCASWEASDGGAAYVLEAPCDLPAGTQVFISYGEKGGEDMLESHGFVPRPPPEAAASVNPYQGLALLMAPLTQVGGWDGLATPERRASSLEYFLTCSTAVEVYGSVGSMLDVLKYMRIALGPAAVLESPTPPTQILNGLHSLSHEAFVLRQAVQAAMRTSGMLDSEWSAELQQLLQQAGLHSPAADAATKATSTPRAEVQELLRQRHLAVEHILSFWLALLSFVSGLAAGQGAKPSMAQLDAWCSAAVGDKQQAPVLPLWHAGDVQSLASQYIGSLLRLPRPQ